MTLVSGKFLQDRYEIKDRLGQGGMGAVYLALDHRFSKARVAIKENLLTSPRFVKQFEREAALLQQLKHPRLARVTDYFPDSSGRQYLVMDYIDGSDLRHILRSSSQPLPEKEVLQWLEQVMDALVYMHDWHDPNTKKLQPILHRDIKPGNIKRTPNGEIFLVDFGLAKFENTTTSITSGDGHTPGYSPPEQYEGITTVCSDIYSLGATLYVLLTNEKPPTSLEIARGKPLIRPRQANPRISRNTERVILKAMELPEANRYQSVREMQADLAGRSFNFRPPIPSSGILPREFSLLGLMISLVSIAIIVLFGYILVDRFNLLNLNTVMGLQDAPEQQASSGSAGNSLSTVTETVPATSPESKNDTVASMDSTSTTELASSSPPPASTTMVQDLSSANIDNNVTVGDIVHLLTITSTAEIEIARVVSTPTITTTIGMPSSTSTGKVLTGLSTRKPTLTPNLELTENVQADRVANSFTMTPIGRPTARPTNTDIPKPTSTPTRRATPSSTTMPTPESPAGNASPSAQCSTAFFTSAVVRPQG